MKELMTLIKREWWEWKRVLLLALGVFTFLLLLTLIPMNRISTQIETEVVKTEDVNSKRNENAKTKLTIDLSNENYVTNDVLKLGELFSKQKHIIKEKIAVAPLTIIKPYSYGVLAGFTFIQLFVMFIGLFYFSDSLYKERSNDSTLFFRSLPVNDHWVLFSKLKAGSIGIIGLSITMLTFLIGYSQIAIMIVSKDIWGIISSPLSEINMLGLFFDLILYQMVALIWISPLILFLMFVSATVRNRPLIVGVGMPILITITLTVIFGENAFETQFGDIFGAIAKMLTEQILIGDATVVSESGVDIFGSFFGDLFSLRTFGSLIVSGLFYIVTWYMYRKNIPTN